MTDQEKVNGWKMPDLENDDQIRVSSNQRYSYIIVKTIYIN